MKSTRLSLNDWNAIEPLLRRAMTAQSADWTDPNQHDPGITMLELLAYALDALVTYSTVDPQRAAPALARINDAVSRVEIASPEVTVDGERWTPVAQLDDVGPDDRVYSIDSEGRVAFGDGVHGRRPPAGSRVAYRSGVGASGDVAVTVRTTWPLTIRRCEVSLDAAGAIAIHCNHDPA